MQMSDGEICRDYLQAKNRIKQIKILANLNACSYKTIERILEKSGLEIETAQTRTRKNGNRKTISYKINAEKAMKMYLNGLSDVEIARNLKLSHSTICKWRKRNNLPSNREVRNGRRV